MGKSQYLTANRGADKFPAHFGMTWPTKEKSNCRHHDFQSKEMSASSGFSVPLTRTTELYAHDGTPRASFLSQAMPVRQEMRCATRVLLMQISYKSGAQWMAYADSAGGRQ